MEEEISLEEFEKLGKKRRTPRSNRMKDRVNSLTESREVFFGYVTSSYEGRDIDFPNSSYYFHKRVLEMIRTNDYDDLFKNELFLEFVYAVLASWGLDRMDGGARLVEFDDFRKSVRANLALLKELSKVKLHELSEEEKEQVKGKLSTLFEKLNVMLSERKLVGISKALHHLLPDLVPPIDKRYTLKFFYGKPGKRYLPDIKPKKEKGRFLEMFDYFYIICKKLELTEEDLNKERKWDTSIPKLIDNAIIGFVRQRL